MQLESRFLDLKSKVRCFSLIFERMTVFGLAVNLPHKAGTIVFIVVLIVLLLLEGGNKAII